MEIYLKAAAGILVAVILGLTLAKQEKDIALLLSVLVCCMILTVAINYLAPMIDFLGELQFLGHLDSEMLNILLKAVGISLLAEVTSLICADAGNAALGKTLQIMAAAAVLWLSIPLFRSLVALVQEILGEV